MSDTTTDAGAVKLTVSKTNPNVQTVTSKTTLDVLEHSRAAIAAGQKPHDVQRALDAQGFDTSPVFGSPDATGDDTGPGTGTIHGMWLASPAGLSSCGTPGKLTRYASKISCLPCKAAHAARLAEDAIAEEPASDSEPEDSAV